MKQKTKYALPVSCGRTECGDIKLKKCTACKLVKYCSVDCQKDHRPRHKKECKKRAIEIRDNELFTQPDGSHYGDCPICFLPMPLESHRSVKLPCCLKEVCIGCTYANELRELNEGLEHRCTLCRNPTSKSKEEGQKNIMERVKANDPAAIRHFLGNQHFDKREYGIAYEHWTKAAQLGDIEAHNLLSNLYREGKGVGKDMKKEVYHMETAAIGGHAPARHNLGCYEVQHGTERAVKHFLISANLGYDPSLGAIWELHTRGSVSKEVYATALRAYQDAVDATKSSQREEGEKAQTRIGLYSTFNHHRR